MKVGVVNETNLGILWYFGTLDKVFVTFAVRRSLWFNLLPIDFKRANDMVKQGKSYFVFKIRLYHVDPRLVPLIVRVYHYSLALVFLFLLFQVS
jgi:hypothetical protein